LPVMACPLRPRCAGTLRKTAEKAMKRAGEI
jgi:hypothetical protein